ncbi:4481_t:CDS:2 [Funneliformis geosporum]|uniref:4481_t:CDS:1 n=1 Tax=Funneliformis geosporum TaxID=1117311 RepID=A0A9W4WRQ0_9GLOM|nr:4481_t:CDS:2 [Funneliformis geosporum]
MPKYTLSTIIYISINILSLFLSTFLIIKLYVSPNHFTKYTQFQLLVASWGYTLGLSPTIINYGGDLMNKAHDTLICKIQQMISLIFLYPLYLFPVILGFYIWHAAENRNIKIEKKYFWIFSSLVWCFTVCYNVFSFVDGYEKENFGVRVTPLLCKPPNSKLNQITYLVIVPLLFCIAIAFTSFATAVLWKRWRHYSVKRNRWTALRYGHALRLFMCSIMYTSFLGIPLLSRVISQYWINSEHPEINKIVVEDFVQPLSGIILFLIFVKNDSPAAFLPCIYYGGPEKLTFKSESYFRDDRILDARPPSLSYSFNDAFNVNPSPTTIARTIVTKNDNLEIEQDTIEILLC